MNGIEALAAMPLS